MQHISVRLVDNNKRPQYGLNWGNRGTRDRNEAYLQLSPSVYNSDFFPIKGTFFLVNTDDGDCIAMTRAQKKDCGTAIVTPENNAILGKYLRSRLGLVDSAEIRFEDIRLYGRIDIDFFKIDNRHYLMDFKKDWKSDNIEHLYEAYLILNSNTDDIKNDIKEISSVSISQSSNGAIVPRILEGKSLSQNCLNFLSSDFLIQHFGHETIDTNKKCVACSNSSSSYQRIFYGAPGTGKSHKIKEILKDVPKSNIFRTTFHPDSDYSTFVGAYKPTKGTRPLYGLNGGLTIRMNDGKDDLNEDIITYKFIPQSFLNAYMQAYRHPEENVYLVIEEINRGNCAQIFGDLFQLLDRDANGVSEYSIKADSDLRAFLEEELGADNDGIKDGELSLPSNLYIFATMNTSDQSLFPIDSAFKRRWDWEYEPIKYKNTDWKIVIGDNEYSWVSFQRIVNEKILEANSSEDKMLGDYFVNPIDGIITENVLLNKILFYLWNDVCKDGDGDIFRVSESEEVTFSQLYGENGKQSLIAMMDYLKVEGSVQDNDYYEQYSRRHLRVELSNGMILEDNNSTNTLVRFINEVGPDKVHALNLKISDVPFISTEKFDEDGRGYANSQRELNGGYYLTTKLPTEAKLSKIEEISNRLNLGVNATIIEI